MSALQSLPAPDVSTRSLSDERWRRERSAFQRLLPGLMKTSAGQFVAICNEQVIATGDVKIEVAQQAYSQCGYQPIFVGQVTSEAPMPVRLPTPRSAVIGAA